MSVQATFFEFLVQIGLIVGLFFAGPLLLFFLVTTYTDHLGSRGKYHRAYRFSRAVYYFTDIPLLRLWIGKFHYFQLRQTGKLAEKIGDRIAALDWLRLASESRFTPSERVHALTALATLLRKQNQMQEAEAAEAAALTIVPNPTGPVGHRRSFADETAATQSAQAGVLSGQGRFAEALALLGQASDLSGGPRFEYSGERVAALRYCGRYEEALSVQDTYEQERQKTMGRLLNTPPKYEKMNTVLRAMENQVRSRYLLTRVALCLEMGKNDDADEHWKSLPEIMDDLTRPMRHAVGAWLSAVQGDEEAANARIAKVESVPLRDDGTRQTVSYSLSRAEIALSDYPRAAERLETLVQNAAHTPLPQAEYRALLAATYAKMGRIADARAQYEQVLAAGFEEAAFTRKARTELSELPATGAIAE